MITAPDHVTTNPIQVIRNRKQCLKWFKANTRTLWLTWVQVIPSCRSFWERRKPGRSRRGRAFLNHVMVGGGNASTSHSIMTGVFSSTVMLTTLPPVIDGGTWSVKMLFLTQTIAVPPVPQPVVRCGCSSNIKYSLIRNYMTPVFCLHTSIYC